MKKTTSFSITIMDIRDPLNLDIETDDITEDINQGIYGLSQDDYTLNSPLIIDNTEAFFRYLFHNLTPQKHLMRFWWKEIKTKFLKFSQQTPNHPSNNHKIWSDISSFRDYNTIDIKELIKNTNNDVTLTFPVLQSFIKGWIGNDILAPIKNVQKTYTLCYGQLFLDAYKLTLLLNCKTRGEYENLRELLIQEGEFSKSLVTVSKVILKSLGTVILGGGFLWLLKYKMIIDRNFLLMMKDTWLARFNSGLSLINRSDQLYSEHFDDTLEEFYKGGDNILRRDGNVGYAAIALLEPLCLERISIMVRLSKPLLPHFVRFTDHLDRTIDALDHGRRDVERWRARLSNLDSIDEVLSIYGVFRHWGHPYLDYLDGLERLHTQVNLPKNIDIEYANGLASDLAKLVLTTQFKEKRKWMVKEGLTVKAHPLHEHIKNNTWPTGAEMETLGDVWHLLPLDKCFEIPDMIEPSVIYADKSHSMNRSRVLAHVRGRKSGPIPSLKVIVTLLENEGTNWKELLQRIDESGLTTEELVIGLKGKERELKLIGRFFALMSWVLREYFVITEYLIKKFFVPLFGGLTMADDLTEVTKKLLESSSGQGNHSMTEISIANHIDYEKWNNHQRDESTSPVFRVMDQFLGYSKLISRTHEFFQRSLIYYNERPDLMIVNGENLECLGNARVTWNGQLGGLEGLRQKGWTIIGMLSIKRESKIRNTKIKILAQGDNQVVSTLYKLPPVHNELEIRECLENAVKNNNVIMDSIIEGSRKLGLIINQNETIQSADLLIYGKIPIVYGCIRSLETKRYSRISCVTNDQIPSLSNVLSTVNTACLTVSHQSASPVETMRQHNFFGNLTRILISIHDPMIQGPLSKTIPDLKNSDQTSFKMTCLYLDPSLGGIAGVSLSRFLIRMFPDPVTESLSFWKVVHDNSLNPAVLRVSNLARFPEIEEFDLSHLDKLLEDPLSLNLKRSVSITFLLKKEIKLNLEKNVSTIANSMIKSSIIYSLEEEGRLRQFLFKIEPLFPRFLSEFRSATYLGVVDSITGLISNSVTMRRIFKSKMNQKIDRIMFQSEINSVKNILKALKISSPSRTSDICSSSLADRLRERSWNRKVIGATVPHPLELLERGQSSSRFCSSCNGANPDDYLVTSLPEGLSQYLETRGPYPVYLGSRTQESTNLLQPWEKEVKIPFLKRGEHLRTAIHWFVDPSSNLAKSIISVLVGLTGEDWSGRQVGFSRTGSALHRFQCSRQSAGGYCATNPSRLSRMITTTDTLSSIGTDNYDFMFQSLILFAQISSGELFDGYTTSAICHHHIGCRECIRAIIEPSLESETIYEHPDMHLILKKWIPDNAVISATIPSITLPEGDWSRVTIEEGSFHIGRVMGFMFGDMIYCPRSGYDIPSLFPLALSGLTQVYEFFDGILDGLLRASSLNVLHRRGSGDFESLGRVFRGSVLYLIHRLSVDPSAQVLFRSQTGLDLMSMRAHRIPPSYPLRSGDMGSMIRHYFESLFSSEEKFYGLGYKSRYENTWIFSDIYVSKMAGLLIMSSQSLAYTTKSKAQKTKNRSLIDLKRMIEQLRQMDGEHTSINKRGILLSKMEVRAGGKEIIEKIKKAPIQVKIPSIIWTEKNNGSITRVRVELRSTGDNDEMPPWDPPRNSSPLISGLRLVQVATGSHYKIRAIFSKINIQYRDFLCGGDGSGGITSFLLRWSLKSRGIFNSLLDYTDCTLRGAHPEGPSAVGISRDLRERCVNFSSCWKSPSDLSNPSTWGYFEGEIYIHELHIDLILLDMEVQKASTTGLIENLLCSNLYKILETGGTLICKTYLTYLANWRPNFLTTFSRYFKNVEVVQTNYTSMYSSEVYVVCRGLLTDPKSQESINWSKLVEDTKKFYCFQTQEQEFKRARLILVEPVLRMIPPQVIPQLWSELTRLWELIGIPVGVASDLAYNLEHLKKAEYSNYFLSICIIACNFIYSFTKNFSSPPPPPSDPAIEGLGSLISGTLMWLGWGTGNRTTYDQGELLFRNEIPMYFSSEKKTVKIKKTNSTQIKYFGKWKVKPPGINKTTRLSRKSALIGSIIRVYARCTRDVSVGTISKDEIYRLCRLINSAISAHVVRSRTGFVDLISDSQIFKHARPRYEVVEIDKESNVWRE